MKRGIIAAAVLLLCGQAAAAGRPHRIMSLKICTDALLLDLAPPERITSVTYLSQEKAALRLWPQAAGLRVNHNTAEEVLAERPDLIITDSFTPPAMRALIARTRAPGWSKCRLPRISTPSARSRARWRRQWARRRAARC